MRTTMAGYPDTLDTVCPHRPYAVHGVRTVLARTVPRITRWPPERKRLGNTRPWARCAHLERKIAGGWVAHEPDSVCSQHAAMVN